MTNELAALQDWFAAQMDRDWDHDQGIEINTLDNPGWRVVIQLTGTELESASMNAVEENYEHDTDWVRVWVEDGRFQGAGGPHKLQRILQLFLEWKDRQVH